MISTIDTVWVLLGTALIFFMQAGFAMVETGFTRAKNAGNIIMKILMDFVFGSLGYWFLGFGLMYGTTSIANGFIGSLDFFITGNYASNVPTYTNVMFQTVFCAAAATIVSGAMAERTKFKAYLIFSVIMSTVIYPISGHWIWGGGWLAQLGLHDFAGSTATPLGGGTSAIVGAAILGPRIGKYTKEGKARAIPGHSLTLGALGVFILWFGWFGFNSASAMGIVDKEILVSRIFMTTNIAGVSAAFAALMITWIKYKKPDVSMTLNGGLAGLVAITAGCGTVTVKGSAIIGLMAGIIVVLGIEFVDKVLKIDDPVGAVGVHCFGGAFGTLMVGFFSYYSPNSTFGDKAGLLYGGGFKFLGVQALGVVTVAAWTAHNLHAADRLFASIAVRDQ
ncbi:MAG: ammonium transporter, partial [Eubacteriales bacterium]